MLFAGHQASHSTQVFRGGRSPAAAHRETRPPARRARAPEAPGAQAAPLGREALHRDAPGRAGGEDGLLGRVAPP